MTRSKDAPSRLSGLTGGGENDDAMTEARDTPLKRLMEIYGSSLLEESAANVAFVLV